MYRDFKTLNDHRKLDAMENLLFNGISVAYLDPGAGSLLMQALAGGSAGLIVFVRHLWNQWHLKRCMSSPGSSKSCAESQ